jgi:plastocyanin
MSSIFWRSRAPLTAVALSAAIAIGLAVPNATPVAAAGHMVQISDSAFGTSVLTIEVGDTVTWTNSDDRPHTVTSRDGAFDSGNLDEGASFSATFDTPGTYAYLCEYHPDMTATIVVEAASPPAPSPAAPASSPGSTAGGAAPPPSHGAGHAGGDQPDTAVTAPGVHVPAASYLLWGSGLLLLAYGLVPRWARSARKAERARGGWRR